MSFMAHVQMVVFLASANLSAGSVLVTSSVDRNTLRKQE